MQLEWLARTAADRRPLPCQPLCKQLGAFQVHPLAGCRLKRRPARPTVRAAAGRPRKTKSADTETKEPSKRKQTAKAGSTAKARKAEDTEAEEHSGEVSTGSKTSNKRQAEKEPEQPELEEESASSQPEEADEAAEETEEDLFAQLQQAEEDNLALLELESRQYEDRKFMPTTRTTPLLNNRDVWERMLQATQMANGSEYRAFYSSDWGGIVTHPALMVVGIDDHMVHRGHAVFDTALITQGYVYQLRQHLERLADSAAKAGLTSPLSMPQMERVVLETAAASRLLNGSIRFWLSAGRGDFALSPANCSPSFYCIAFVPPTSPFDEIGDGVEGMRVKTSIIPPKHDYFATLKSTNYLQNALALMNAQDEDVDQAIFVTPDGYVAEASNANLGIVTAERDLIMPPFDHSLRGITAETILSLARQYLATGELENVRSIEQRPITLEEAQAADEVFLCSSTLAVAPVVVWDGIRINEGLSGLVTMSLRAMIIRHMNPQYSLGEHLEVPYGYLTSMPSVVS